MTVNDGALSVSDVAKLLNVHKTTVYRMAKTGRLNFKRIGKLWRIQKADVDAYFHKDDGVVKQEEGS